MDYNAVALNSAKLKNVATATNAAATATFAGVTRQAYLITGVTISASGTPAAAVSVTIKDGTTVIEQIEIPAATFAPVRINYNRPLEITIGATVAALLPALGAGIKGTISLHGFAVQS